MKVFSIVFMLILILAPMIFIGQTKKSDSSESDLNKTASLIKNFKYLEMNASGLCLFVTGDIGYHFANNNAIITPFTMYRLDQNITEKLTSKRAEKTAPFYDFIGDVVYTRSDGVLVKTNKATYDDVNKTLTASPVYATIKVKE